VVRVGEDRRKSVLRVEYRIIREQPLPPEQVDREMEKVADEAIELYKGKDRETLHSIQVVRHAVRGSGCMSEKHTTSFAKRNPYKPENPYRFND
jgi:hypothetical protein